MQTLRKRNSPCKYKNEPSRFLGEGMTFKAKLIGILEVNEARGDKMCQEALNDLKMAIRAAGEHKQRITISISIDGLRLRDEKTGDCMYHHPVHKISFIAQDMSDSRAFGYIFGSPDTGHRFFGIKTDKTASQVVISMRDLFQVVFELKKKEIEMAKHHIEQHQVKYGTSNSATREESEPVEKTKGKSLLSSVKNNTPSSINENNNVVMTASNKTDAIADLLDLEHELNNIQQGINQMERITPSDPFGPLGRTPESFLDPFDDSFQTTKPPNTEPTFSLSFATGNKSRSVSQSSTKEESMVEKPRSLFSSTTSVNKIPGGLSIATTSGRSVNGTSKTDLFSNSTTVGSSGTEEVHWFDKETECLFSDASTTHPDSSSPLTYHTPTADPDKTITTEKKSPLKTDLFTELDPLGTGRVKPYIDKKDFFQELKNPPKKVLKDLLEENTTVDNTFATEFTSSVQEQPRQQVEQTISTKSSKSADPFEDGDPFDKTDPFLQDDFPQSIGFPPFEAVFNEAEKKEMEESKTSGFISSCPLRVTLPPERGENNTSSSTGISLSTITHNKLRMSPSPPDDVMTSSLKKYYHTFKQSDDDKKSGISYMHIQSSHKSSGKRFYIKELKHSSQSPPPKIKDQQLAKKLSSSSAEYSDTTPEPLPKTTSALFSIKPPPLPPKKQNCMFNLRPPARPPSLEDSSPHYDFLKNQEQSLSQTINKKEEKSPVQNVKDVTEKVKKLSKTEKHESMLGKFPLLPPPPQRKTGSVTDTLKHNIPLRESSIGSPKPVRKSKKPVLNITLSQLDHAGLQDLTDTLGIPYDNIYKMTLQELTQLLADHNEYNAETDSDVDKNAMRVEDNSFEADFSSNFGDLENETSLPPPEDRYAAFKELMESECTVATEETAEKEVVEEEEVSEVEETVERTDVVATNRDSEDETTETKKRKESEEEDKYAALRHLSLCTQRSENLSEELDVSNEDDSSSKLDNTGRGSEEIPLQEPSSIDAKLESPGKKVDEWGSSVFIDKQDSQPSDKSSDNEKDKVKWSTDDKFDDSQIQNNDQQIASTQGKLEVEELVQTNWAKFDAAPVIDNVKVKGDVNETENSPISSDGKDDMKRSKFDWKAHHKRIKGRYDVPWMDEDESWDEYSAKESYWSDESSHDEKSPGKPLDRYHRRQYRAHPRMMKGPMWDHKWHDRDRSRDETEDEYEESWRGYGSRVSPYEGEMRKKGSREVLDYEDYRDKRTVWCEERKEPLSWDERQRKRSESDEEYRKRCGSDTPERDYEWNFKRGCSADKYDKYYGSEKERDYRFSDHCHERTSLESRSKHKKMLSQKRPSSASETKRNNYEMIYSPVDHKPRTLFSPKHDYEPEFPPRYHPPLSHREPRYHHTIESDRYYDRRGQYSTQRRYNRVKRNETIGPIPKAEEKYSIERDDSDYSESRRSKPYYADVNVEEHPGKRHPLDSKKLRHKQFQFEDDFSPTGNGSVESPTTKLDESSFSPKISWHPKHDAWSERSKSGSTGEEPSISLDNNNQTDNFANFENDRVEKQPPKSFPEHPSTFAYPKSHLKPKNHFATLGRQDSSSSLRKSESINIFSRENDPFEDDDFFSSASPNNVKLNRYSAEKSKSNSNVSDPFTWKQAFGRDQFQD